MEIVFRNAKIRKICNDDGHARKKLGEAIATKLRRRLDDLNDADCLEDLRHSAGRIEELTADLKGQISMRLDKSMRLLFEPAETFSFKEDGGLDWRTVTAIIIIKVEDYHG